MEEAKKKRGHLRIEDRRLIEEGIEDGRSASAIAAGIGVSPSTVTREVRANRTVRGPRPGEPAAGCCAVYDSCVHVGDACPECARAEGGRPGRNTPRCRACGARKCHLSCPDFAMGPRCGRTLRWPFVCPPGCPDRAGCRMPKVRYRAQEADAAAEGRKSAPRKGICCTPEELRAMNELVTPLLRQGQSPEAVWLTHADELPVGWRTYYNYMEAGLTDAVPLDLPRKVRRKPSRKKGRPLAAADRAGRTHDDFMALPEEERLSCFQADTVVGRACDSQRVLSLHAPRLSLQLYLLSRDGTSAETVRQFDALEALLGSPGAFRAVFGLVLADRGSEFDDIEGMERSSLAPGERRCRVFFCDPMRSEQKAECERNHSELRRILPKGRTNFDALTERDVALACSHVNSYPRASLGGACPLALGGLVYGPGLFKGLGVELVAPDEVVLRPELVPHAMVR